MIPVTKEQSEAIKETASFGSTLVTETANLARYVGRILGTVPENVAGIVLDEPLRFVRAVIADKIDKKIDDIHARRGVTQTQPVSPSLAIPLLQAAYNESNEELQKIWAELIAAAMDPNRANRVRKQFIDTVKQLDPIDAFLLKERTKSTGIVSPSVLDHMMRHVNISRDEFEVSVQNLVKLGCVGVSLGTHDFHLSPYGRELMRACSD